MNIIEAVKTIINNYPKIAEFSNQLHVDYTSDEATNYGISSTGDIPLREDVLGNQYRQHNFVLYAVNQSFNDYTRLANSTFLLELNYWIETIQGNPITVNIEDAVHSGTLTSMSCANAMMYQVGETENDPIMYQIQIYAQYKVESEDF